ncbi:jg23072 [Pararge aegeria aegeria]|uniref:Jg23072 protein n=1 Tax=Pararge aegeria aegeria TaxID=348720 RepID=A0A8S4S4J0_9NEOP|nr:jg23072 [Pararge aegeria aegeria]
MDLNLSNICDMLGDRIEEYKTTSKKRRIGRESCAPKPKIAKITYHGQTENSTKKKNGVMYASTPVVAPTTETKISALPARFSTIKVTKFTGKIINARKLAFNDAEDSIDSNEKSEIEKSPASFFSTSKVNTLETLKRRSLQRSKTNVRRLFVDEDDQKNGECLSKYTAKTSFAVEEEKYVKSVAEYSESDVSLSKVLTPLYTPERHLLRRSMNARRLSFGDENEDMSFVNSSPNAWPSKEKSSQTNLAKFDKDVVEDMSISAETSYPEELMDCSSMIALNVRIFIRPIH